MSQLHLHQPPAIIFLFGLAGSGKSYVGDLIARYTGWFVYHADEDITEAMQQALDEQRPFSEAIRDEFFAQLTSKIRQLASQHPNLIVTQAVYKQRHRDLLEQHIAGLEFVWVKASDEMIEQRLQSRHYGIEPASAAALRDDFEIPNKNYKTIVNESDDNSIIEQLNGLFQQ
jgi:gluconate kinase